jgi:hypothetical protein
MLLVCQAFWMEAIELAANIGETFLYEKGKESRGEAGKARDARAA